MPSFAQRGRDSNALSPQMVAPPPAISGLSPASGPVGTAVTITGTNFRATQGTSIVTFNGTDAGAATSWSNTAITISVPAGAASGNVSVTIGGVSSNPMPFTVTAAAAPGAFAYERAITIDHTKVQNSDQQNFTVLISGRFGYLATVANGGKVQSDSGFDIAFAADPAGTQLLSWEIDSYSPVTGAAGFWVKVPLLSSTADTVIYLLYGNPAVSDFLGGAAGSAWDSGDVRRDERGDGVELER